MAAAATPSTTRRAQRLDPYSGSPRHGPKKFEEEMVEGRPLPGKTPVGKRRRRRIPGIALRLSVASRTSDELTVLVGESTTFGSIHVCSPATLLTSASASALGYVRVRACPASSKFVPKASPGRNSTRCEGNCSYSIMRHWRAVRFPREFRQNVCNQVKTQRGVPLRVA